jgi:hypothetical protein
MCNSANPAYDCDCGFGGVTGGGGRRGQLLEFHDPLRTPSFGWARDNGGTVASYVNADAHCPACGTGVEGPRLFSYLLRCFLEHRWGGTLIRLNYLKQARRFYVGESGLWTFQIRF